MMLDAAAHKNILIRILKDIYTNAAIGPFLGFKGGTAAYLFYELDRFSVDLDFDLLDSSKEKQVFEQLKEILKKYGIIKESYEKRYTFFFAVSYSDKLQNIKIEVNRRDFGSRYEVKSYLGIPMKVMVKEDMAAHKMVAMLERLGNANRDIFDTYFFLKNNWPINDQIITKRTGLSMPQFLKKCIEGLEFMSNHGILSGLGDLLDAKKKAWVKENLRTETIFLLKIKLDNYPVQPRAFIYSYKEGGNMFDPSGLGSRFYNEYKVGGIYHKALSPATVIIHFDKQCSEAFLDMFLHAVNEKNITHISGNQNGLKGIKHGQSLSFQTYQSEQKIQEWITELNRRFSE